MRIEKLEELFPNCITEKRDENGKIIKAVNYEIFKQMFSKERVEPGEEAYEFTWVGKKESILEANKPIRKTLRPCKEESKDWDNTENLYIEGDNLEVLKTLQESYLNSIKMIYIDPPYNTGNDFIYNDEFKMSNEEYIEETGQVDEDGNRLFKNTDTNGRFHSDWCSMMYPRLVLARNLLSDDGVIFISIDDNEQDNLKKICDEVFGEKNFITQFIWEKTSHFGRQKKNYYSNSEFILCYGKNIYSNNFLKELLVERIESELEDAPLYNNSNPFNELEFPAGSVKFNIPDGVYKKSTDKKFELLEPVEVKEGMNKNKLKIRMKSRWSQKKIDVELKKGSIYLVKSNKFSIRVMYSEDKTTKVALKQIVFTNRNNPLCVYNRFGEKVGTNDEASAEVNKLFKESIFSYPKPVSLIKYLLSSLYNENNDEHLDDFTVLDFFSGSATTAHAVMELNAEDGGNRKFIMVQLPEETDEKSEAYKAGYKNICEIGKERIRRAGEKIKEDNKDKEGIENLDTGFRVLKIDDTNMKDVYYRAEDYTQDLLDRFESNIKDDRNDLDLLFGCLLDWGLPLDRPYESIDINGNKIHIYNSGDLIACFDDEISEETVKEIAKMKSLRVVFRDSSFTNDPKRINVEEIFKLLSPDTSIRVI